jgi:hypothetical protein
VTALKEVVQRVDTILADASRRSMAEQRDHVRTYVSEALLVRALGQDDPVIYRRRLADDAQLTAATGILRNAKEYQRLLASQRK